MLGESKIPLCKPSGGKLLLRPSLSSNELLHRVAFRLLSNIHDGAPLGKKPLALTGWLFLQKGSTTDVRRTPNVPLIGGAVNVECRWTARVWNLLSHGIDQTIKNLTCGDLEILLVVIRLGVTWLKKTGLVYLLDFLGRGEEGWWDLVSVKPT